MAEGIHVRSNLDELAAAFRRGDVVLGRHVGGALRELGKPLGKEIVRKGAAGLGRRGGLSARVARGAKAEVTARLGGSSPEVTLRLQSKDGDDLAGMNAGEVHHPVFARAGQPRTWVRQSIAPDLFTKPLEEAAPKVRARVLDGVQAALSEIARDAK